MLKKAVLLLFIFPSIYFAQVEYVFADNPVYDFLNRMETLRLIENYNPFEIPKSRGEVGKFLKELLNKREFLDEVDNKILMDLVSEFEVEINCKDKNHHYSGDLIIPCLSRFQSLIGDGKYDIFSQQEKYLFFYFNPGRANLFINLLAEGELIFHNNSLRDINSSASLGFYGGEIRGTLLNKFGFLINGYQGQVFGSRQTAQLKKEVAYNFKFNLAPDEGFYDETYGYMSADFDLLKLKFGRDRLLIGHGKLKPLVADNSPMFDYLSLNVNYEFLSFSYFHGKLLGNSIRTGDSITGGSNIVDEKYIGYHRLNFDLSPYISFGAGEIIIYGERGIDLTYLNPFTFYKSVEHSNKDRDNSMLFFDLNTKPLPGLKAFGTLLIDDISFGKIGSGWYGNKTLFHAGVFSSNLYKIVPLDLSLEYIRIEPYTLTHRLSRNSFTHDGYNIGSVLHPNSELFFTQINYRFNNRLSCSASFNFTRHGANPVNIDGTISENVGGNINFGHRINDSETVSFLDGDLEYFREFSFEVLYEPFNQIIFSFNIIYSNNSLQRSVNNRETQIFLSLNARI